MCWSCNPYCGGCKPPKEKPVKCPGCNAYTFRDASNQCGKCGTVLPERVKPPTVMCLYIGKLCANPCNRHKKAPEEESVISCIWHTPPQDNG